MVDFSTKENDRLPLSNFPGMNTYTKYFNARKDGTPWGLQVINAGCSSPQPFTKYPSPVHPTGYNFDWNSGRILYEYQIIYITRGGGLFESERSGTRKISEGQVIFLFPNEKHRYRPDTNTGWDELWVGFNGNIIEDVVREKMFTPENPVVEVGYDEVLLNLFFEVIRHLKDGKLGNEPIVSGLVMHILGHVVSVSRTPPAERDETADLVNKARTLLLSNIEVDITPMEIARELNMSYSKFRKLFKAETGVAPGQYQLQLRINRAKELLSNPCRSVKEIAYELNFQSDNYFSKFFKEKTGLSPQQFRLGIHAGSLVHDEVD